jgi:metallo-beta-lactamase family protein
MIKLGFYGAAGEVTGSCYLVTTDLARVLVDMGMHQGEREAHEHNRRLPPIDFGDLDAVVLTHAHLDHCGRLPLLTKNGYRGKIHCTPSTADITEIILRDSARLQAEDYARYMRHNRGQPSQRESLYSEQDVEHTLSRLITTDYDEVATIAEGIMIRFVDAGHILGAASVQLLANDGDREVTVVFSGDVGQIGSPILRDPITPIPANAVILESTYGDHDHRSLTETCGEFLTILEEAQAVGAKVLIPAFAVGRTQDLIFHMGEFLRDGKLKNLNVYVDSPMAVSVSDLYARHTSVYDDHATKLLKERLTPLGFPGLKYIRTVDESKRLNDIEGFMVVIAASGMCTGGRILHHLNRNLSDPQTHIVIVGYQGQGTLGRRLVDGAKYVSIFRHDLKVRARIHTLGGFSAHAGQAELLNWATPFQQTKPRIFLTHGEDRPRIALQCQLEARLGLIAAMPYYEDEVEL